MIMNVHVLWNMLLSIILGLSLLKNEEILFYFIHMRPPWRVFTGATSRTAPFDRLNVVLQGQWIKCHEGCT
ncbi:hypothetical protein H5410_060308 [Solanum commersonii]|uniref:Uncharacterized protein n=1 Tax=Solanum commersonii TaxID=4109 RepID=A0A9J5W661_SOLCO|nr:hypothetical protein H5410_060308 [Solanum commersonii]